MEITNQLSKIKEKNMDNNIYIFINGDDYDAIIAKDKGEAISFHVTNENDKWDYILEISDWEEDDCDYLLEVNKM